MAMTRSDFTDLVVPLHEGVHDLAPWALFLDRLRQRTRADAAAIDVRPADGGPVSRFGSGAVTAMPGGPWPDAMRAGRVYGLDECDVDAPGVGRVVRVEESGGASSWLLIWRGQRDFAAADGAVLTALVPHLAIAVRTRQALDRHALRHTVYEAALARANVGWVALARDARVLAMSAVAATMLGDHVGERLVAGRAAGLVGREAAVAIADFCLAPAGALAVALDDAAPAAMLLLPAAADAATTVTPAAAIGLVVTKPGGDLAGRAAILAALHGLAPSEARFAAAIASGASLATAAAALGLTIETARNYSKRVYAKTRTAGQVDLVRMAGESVVRLG